MERLKDYIKDGKISIEDINKCIDYWYEYRDEPERFIAENPEEGREYLTGDLGLESYEVDKIYNLNIDELWEK